MLQLFVLSTHTTHNRSIIDAETSPTDGTEPSRSTNPTARRALAPFQTETDGDRNGQRGAAQAAPQSRVFMNSSSVKASALAASMWIFCRLSTSISLSCFLNAASSSAFCLSSRATLASSRAASRRAPSISSPLFARSSASFSFSRRASSRARLSRTSRFPASLSAERALLAMPCISRLSMVTSSRSRAASASAAARATASLSNFSFVSATCRATLRCSSVSVLSLASASLRSCSSSCVCEA
mmetsp:Transcript_40468/g.92977  ORF Transcript_40468/g.92977 Transcript_40468/m.92977 type:complete len:242 (-) Transcript_40468:762-1487(-)